MKSLIIAAAAVAVSFTASAQTYVSPYVKKDGTFVEGHYKSAPNSTKTDNYSSQGNSNPFTGQQGKVDPYAPKSCGTDANGRYVCR